MTILDTILAQKRPEVAEARATTPLAELEKQLAAAPVTRDFVDALRRQPGEPIRVLAEYKRASPSAGVIREDLEVEEVAAAYARGGAAAMSVLTDREFFRGELAFLSRARSACDLPLLRKDFIIDRYQLVEARVHGADAVLLIVSVLDDATLRELHGQATELGLAALVEVHSQEEAERAVQAGASIIGVNHRNLKTFEIDMTLTARLVGSVPPGVVFVAESGIRGHADAAALAEAGAHAVLVGEHLMRQADLGGAVGNLIRGES